MLDCLSQMTQGWMQDSGGAPLSCCTWAPSKHLHPNTHTNPAPHSPSSPIKSTEVCASWSRIHSKVSRSHGWHKSALSLSFRAATFPYRVPQVNLTETLYTHQSTVDNCMLQKCYVSCFTGLLHPRTLFQQSDCCPVSTPTNSTTSISLETVTLYRSQNVALCRRIPRTLTQTRPNSRIWNRKNISHEV